MSEPTYLGTVSAVAGSSVNIELSPQLDSGLVVLGGKTHRIGQVGSFVRIPQGYSDLFGVISETSESSTEDEELGTLKTKRRWLRVELVGETVGDEFERGIGQYPSINDEAHLVTDTDLKKIYGDNSAEQVIIGKLSSSDSINVSLDIEKLITRHSAVVGSTGSGKSTSVSSLIRSIVCDENDNVKFPSSRIILIDLHGEYSAALEDLAKVYSVFPAANEDKLVIPYWCISSDSLLDFLCGALTDQNKTKFIDKIIEEKKEFVKRNIDNESYKKIEEDKITGLTPIPYRIKKVWYDLLHEDTVNWEDKEKVANPAYEKKGDIETIAPPIFKPPGSGAAAPHKGGGHVVRRPLDLFRSRLLDTQYSFLLSPDEWEPNEEYRTESDLDDLLKHWIGHDKPITIFDLSGLPSTRLDLLLGALLDILFEAAIWGRNFKEGMRNRPLLMVLEEAHRYLSSDSTGFCKQMVRRIAKEGRKFGLGTMLVSQRPSEIDETILSQCGTLIALRINNSSDRNRVRSAMSEGVSGLIDSLPILRTGEAIITGESAKLPTRCKFKLPKEGKYPDSKDPQIAKLWKGALGEENYENLVLAWRNQNSRKVNED